MPMLDRPDLGEILKERLEECSRWLTSQVDMSDYIDLVTNLSSLAELPPEVLAEIARSEADTLGRMAARLRREAQETTVAAERLERLAQL